MPSDITNGEPGKSAKKKSQKNGCPDLLSLRPQLQSLNAYSVSVRYPGEAADKSMAQEGLRLAKSIRSEVRQKLGLGF
jgi:hypothetical protein